MPLNILKKYNQLLELTALSTTNRKTSLMGVFDRDITNNTSFKFQQKNIHPTPIDGVIEMETLYSHLTTLIVDRKTGQREFELDRSLRLHWVKYHIDETKRDNVLIYSVKEPDGNRTYIYDKDEKYVVVLAPLRELDEYYLLTAFYVKGKDAKRDKYVKKYKRRLTEVL